MISSISGPELLAAVLNPQCGATIWVRNTGVFGPSVNNGIGNCIQARLVDQEGGGSVGRSIPFATSEQDLCMTFSHMLTISG